MKHKREFYIQTGSVKVAPKNLPVEFYLYEFDGKPFAQCFVGRAQKPTWHYRFKSVEQREKRMNQQIESVALHEKTKAERREQRKNHSLQSGDILVSSWGYEQTNVDFYKVTQRIGKTMVEFVKIPSVQMKDTYEAHGMACKVVPHVDYETKESTKHRARVSNNTIKISSCSYARKWDGKPEYCSWYA